MNTNEEKKAREWVEKLQSITMDYTFYGYIDEECLMPSYLEAALKKIKENCKFVIRIPKNKYQEVVQYLSENKEEYTFGIRDHKPAIFLTGTPIILSAYPSIL